MGIVILIILSVLISSAMACFELFEINKGISAGIHILSDKAISYMKVIRLSYFLIYYKVHHLIILITLILCWGRRNLHNNFYNLPKKLLNDFGFMRWHQKRRKIVGAKEEKEPTTRWILVPAAIMNEARQAKIVAAQILPV